MTSPYKDLEPASWEAITRSLINQHPLNSSEIVDIVLSSWNSIFSSSFGSHNFSIGIDIFPKPQIMGFLLHELIPLELASRYPKNWRGDERASEKDLVYLPDENFSIEVKTSSHSKHIFGNRSFAQKTSEGKKAKSGYYLAINFEKFGSSKIQPAIIQIKFGWIDSDDWIGQKSSTGQQCRLPRDVEQFKLLQLYKKS